MEFLQDPFLILFVGIAIVIGLIVFMRINAFIALITAALVVSLMAPGEIQDKIGRVATAFGNMAGGIGIVIAMAAVIGKCLMESGAADRIVQAFLKALGEKRSSIALAGSGFVLSIPVFFDTVFYLLVPLARSLYRNTKQHYLKYVLAISAGAAITHTLVPPTPGPLLMAQLLGVSLGTMIGVGVLIGIPASIVGLAYGSWLDKRMPIEMRPLPGDEALHHDEASSETRKLPGLMVSLLPILLPVVLIGINTALETRANDERAAQLTLEEKVDWEGLRRMVEDAKEDSPLAALGEFLPGGNEGAEALVAGFNKAIVQKSKDQLRKNLAYVEHENREAIEKEVPEEILPRQVWNTPKREQFNVSKFYGNPNFALLLSAVVAVFLYVRMRRPTKSQFSETIESSLMSAGLIILITASGGAFGAMLKEAQIGDAIEALFTGGGEEAQISGIMLLLLAFVISAVIKGAQGSTTVAVITAAGMIAAMLEGVENLGFNPVYLATAIGGGGLIGSWMNDSGFWIFSKMGGISEVEALKSWTPLLCVLGGVTFVMSVILSIVLPLV